MQTELMTTLGTNNRGLISVWPAVVMETKTPRGHGRRARRVRLMSPPPPRLSIYLEF